MPITKAKSGGAGNLQARAAKPAKNHENRTYAVLAARQKIHGSFSTHARIAQALKAVMQDSPNWSLLHDDAKESLEMIQHKIARVLNGNQDYEDHWRDIAGYATLVADDRLKEMA